MTPSSRRCGTRGRTRSRRARSKRAASATISPCVRRSCRPARNEPRPPPPLLIHRPSPAERQYVHRHRHDWLYSGSDHRGARVRRHAARRQDHPSGVLMLSIRFDKDHEWWVSSQIFERLFASALHHDQLSPELEEWRHVADANGEFSLADIEPAVHTERDRLAKAIEAARADRSKVDS